MSARRAGTRPHYVELQESVDRETPDGFVSEWVTFWRAWAAIVPAAASPTERPVANTTQSPATHLVTVDYHERLASKQRVKYGVRHLYIVNQPQDIDERHETLVLSCEERAA